MYTQNTHEIKTCFDCISGTRDDAPSSGKFPTLITYPPSSDNI